MTWIQEAGSRQREAGLKTEREAGLKTEREAGLKTERKAGLRLDPDRERLDPDRERLDPDRERLDSRSWTQDREVGLKTCRSLFHKVVASYVLKVLVCLKAIMCLHLHHYYCQFLPILWQLRPQTLHSLAPGNSFSLALHILLGLLGFEGCNPY